MNSVKSILARLVREEEGAAAAEYAILVAFIAGAVAAAVQLFHLDTIFSTVSSKVIGWVNNAPTP